MKRLFFVGMLSVMLFITMHSTLCVAKEGSDTINVGEINDGEEDGAEGYSYITNPHYDNILTEQDFGYTMDINSESYNETEVLDLEKYETDVTKVINKIRGAMENRQENIQVHYASNSQINNSIVDQWFESVFEETDSPTQGDYLRYVYGGCGWEEQHHYENGLFYSTINFSMKYYTTNEQEEELTNVIEEVIEGFSFSNDTSDYKKIKTIYDYLCKNITYDYQNLDNEDYLLKYTAYAALVNKTAVCQGYATLLYRMLKMVDIDTRVIAGIGNGEKHAWNIVKIDGRYYNLDATWDAKGSNEYLEMAGYAYLLKGDAYFSDHEREEKFATNEFYLQYPISEEDYVSPDEKVIISENFKYKISEGTAELLKYMGSEVEVNVPSTVEGYPVKVIATSAFKECHTIEVLTLSEGIMTMQQESIFSCISLRQLNLPSSLKVSFENGEGDIITGLTNMPMHCPNLKEINVSEGNEDLVIKDGVLFDKEMTVLLYYPQGKMDKEYWIPEGVFTIGNSAFEGNNYLQKIVMPDTISYIGYWAFCGDGLLREMNISENCKFMGQYALNGTKIEVLEIPANLEWIHLYEFNMSNLKAWIVDENNKNYSSKDGVLYDKNQLTMLSFPMAKEGSFEIPDSVTHIESGAIPVCNLSKITVPSSVTVGIKNFQEVNEELVIYGYEDSPIQSYTETHELTFVSLGKMDIYEIASGICGDNMTWSLTSDGELKISGNGIMEWDPNDGPWSWAPPWYEYGNRITYLNVEGGVENIAENAFNGCGEMISEINLPNSVKSIGNAAFTHCDSLIDLILPEGVEEIGNSTFYYCESLKNIYLPASLKQIGDCVFEGCYNLENISINADNEHYKVVDNVLFDINMEELLLYPAKKRGSYRVPDGVLAIGRSAFYRCTGINSIILPDSVEKICENAFADSYVTAIYLGKEVTQIEKYAFKSAQSLHTVIMGENVRHIGIEAFTGTYSLQSIYFSETNEKWEQIVIEAGNEKLYAATINYMNITSPCDINVHLVSDWIPYKEATCTETGNYTYTICDECGKHFSDSLGSVEIENDSWIIPATGHNYGTPEYVWSEDFKTCTATIICANDRTHIVTETVNSTSAVTTPATCEKKGTTIYTATFTNSFFETQTKFFDDIPILTTHTQTEVVRENEVIPTCEAEGYYDEVVKCSICGEEISRKTVTVEALGHDYGEWERDGTEGEQDTHTHKCTRCGKTETEEHNWDSGEVTKEATCAEEGIRTYTCEECGATKVESITKKAHTIVTDEEVAPTCEESGLIAGSHCSVCNEVIVAQEEVVALGHDYGEVKYTWGEDYSTCTAEKKCTRIGCNEEITVTVNTTSEVAKAATCMDKGTTTYTAAFDDLGFETQTKNVDVEAIGHSYGTPVYTWSDDGKSCEASGTCTNDPSHVVTEKATVTGKITMPASCKEKGKTTYTAEFTNTLFAIQTKVVRDVELLETHTFAEVVKENEVKATCETDGSYDEVVYCSVCGKEMSRETKSVSALGHDWGEWMVKTSATETTEGVEERVCKTDVSHTETRAIPLLSHTHVLIKVEAKSASCIETGNIEYWICSGCNKLFADKEGKTAINAEDIVAAKIAHTPAASIKEKEVAASCETDGSYDEVIYCSVCGDEISRKTVTGDALGHDYKEVEGNAKVAATCTDAGKEADKKCSRCGDVITGNVIDAAGHDFGEWEIKKQPTETAEGLEERVCKNDAAHKETRSIAKLESKPVTDDKEKTSTGEASSTGDKTAPTTGETPKLKDTPATKDTTLTDESTKATFVVTSSAGEEPTVEYKAADVADKTVKISDSVTIGGVT